MQTSDRWEETGWWRCRSPSGPVASGAADSANLGPGPASPLGQDRPGGIGERGDLLSLSSGTGAHPRSRGRSGRDRATNPAAAARSEPRLFADHPREAMPRRAASDGAGRLPQTPGAPACRTLPHDHFPSTLRGEGGAKRRVRGRQPPAISAVESHPCRPPPSHLQPNPLKSCSIPSGTALASQPADYCVFRGRPCRI